ncbi:MAG: hypothetical protein RJQ10_02615, partial [Haliea sp.]|uniref:hypothetical protein n=1 Tax=Haliea sp. TaxID=1932666 RepID=UPI0032EEF8F5
MIKLVSVFLVRSLGALGAVALLFTAGRFGGVALIGTVATLQVIALGAAIFSCLGAGQYLNKIAAYENDCRHRILISTLCLTTSVSAAVTAVFAACLEVPAVLELFDITP